MAAKARHERTGVVEHSPRSKGLGGGTGWGKGWDLVVFLARGTWLEIHHGLINSKNKITTIKHKNYT